MESENLSRKFDIPARFLSGTFFPDNRADTGPRAKARREADLTYVYPWPDQEIEIYDLFDQSAKPGAYLLAYHGIEDIRIFRKTG